MLDKLAGQILDEKYKIEKLLGQGGMGAVYLGQHITIGKPVAIKVLLSDTTKENESLERFKREAEATARIKHPNIVGVSDFGQTDDGLTFMVMEYIQGYSLRSLLDRETKLAPKHAVKFVCQICAAMTAAHEAGIIHRDLKPDNIMIEVIDGFEVARVLDFGIAKLKDSQQQQLTAVGGAIGTATYMSPEQCSSFNIDARSDIYSIGIILYQLLSGQLPFQSNNRLAIIIQQMTKPPQPLEELCPDLPAELIQVVMKALEKDPESRQQSASELSEQLKKATDSVNIMSSIYGSTLGSNKLLNPSQDDSKAFTLVKNEQLEGVLLDNKYRLIRQLGQGGMGTVYLGQHISIGKLVAIKTLLSNTKETEIFERFKREAEATARIKHPNIVGVSDFGQTDDGLTFMVMDYVQGYSLRLLLERFKRLSSKRVITIGRQICAAMTAAHEAGIIHRDLKPDNIMIEIIDGLEVIRVLDFGIAKLKDAYQQQLTVVGGVIGTAIYMSPEQCGGDNVDARSDIYSIGIILYQLLCGQPPFQSTNKQAILLEQMTKLPQPLEEICPNLPIELVKVVMQALEKDPDLRQQSTAELSKQLKATLSSIASYNDKHIEDTSPQQIISKTTSNKLNINKRFTLNRSLGSGAFGSVYEAYDNEHATLVALKMLRQANAEQLYQFKREFRSLTDIIHPNLVTLYELMSDGEQWFFTMQLVEGVDFLKWVRENNSGFDLDRLKNAFMQLVEGIHALHKAGKLHRDIKPSNVLVTSEGSVVILDFGLIMESSFQDSTNEIAGTPAYMSPEQAIGSAVSEASDWYSAGVMLYEALTGKLPITGNSALELLINKQKDDPLPPSTNVAGISATLDLLCQDLLKRDPATRPSGVEILNRLKENSNTISATTPLSFPLPPFIGRESQLTDLNNTYKDVKSGKAGIAFVKGYSGMGKSALVRHFLDEILEIEPGVVVLTGRCYEQETVPYKALDSVIDSLTRYLKSLPKPEVKEILPVNILALARLFPVLKQVEAVTSANRSVLDIPDLQELRQKAFAAFKELISKLANKKQLIIFIDDYQWSDFDSTSLLSELICPPDVPLILLICSYRAEEAETNAVLKQLSSFQAYAEAITISNISVKELSEVEAKTVITSLLGEDTIDLEIINRIIKESGGSPFFLYELTQYYQSQLSSLNLTNNSNLVSIEEVLKSRISQLSDKARSLLEVVAVSGQPVERNLAKVAAKLTADEQVLAALRAGRFVRILKHSEKEEMDTYHDRIRETAIATIPNDKMVTYHTNLGLALEVSSSSDPERLLYHFKESGDKKKATKYALIAASSADQALAFVRASQHYKTAIEMNVLDKKELQEAYIKLAQALANAGRGAESSENYLLAANLVEGKDSLEFQRRAAEQLLMCGHLDEGTVIFRRLLNVVGIRWPQTSTRLLIPLLFNRFWIWLRGVGFRYTEEKEIPSKTLFQVDICGAIAVGLAQSDALRGAYFNTKHLLLALKAGEPFRILRALNLEIGFTSILKEARKYTQTLFEKEKEISKKLNHPYGFGLVKLSEGYIAFQQGKWKLALLSLEESAKIFRENCTGVTWETDTIKYFSLCSLQLIGNYNEVYHRLPTLILEAKERNDLFLLTLSRARYSSVQYLIADEPKKAMDEIDQTMDQWSHDGFHHQHYVSFSARVMAHLYNDHGKSSLAYEFINKQWPALRGSMLLNVQVIRIEARQMRANSTLAAATTNNSNTNLLLAIEQDAKKIESEGLTYGIAIALMLRAGVAAIKKDTANAIKLLISAEETFNAADMGLHAAIARRRRGELIGKNEGQELILSADSWMKEQQIQNPERMAAVFAPGNWLA